MDSLFCLIVLNFVQIKGVSLNLGFKNIEELWNQDHWIQSSFDLLLFSRRKPRVLLIMGLVPIIIVPGQTTYMVPVELMNHINAAQYQEIVNAVLAAREKGCNYACMVEWGVCIVTCIWCVFFCHTCIENAMVESELLK